MPRLLLAACTIAVLAGCSTPATNTPAAPDTVTAKAPACADTIHDGQPVTGLDDTQPQCLDPDGGLVILAAQRCADGTRLVTVPATSGAHEGWYLTGQRYHAVNDVPKDTGYAAAYTACQG